MWQTERLRLRGLLWLELKRYVLQARRLQRHVLLLLLIVRRRERWVGPLQRRMWRLLPLLMLRLLRRLRRRLLRRLLLLRCCAP